MPQPETYHRKSPAKRAHDCAWRIETFARRASELDPMNWYTPEQTAGLETKRLNLFKRIARIAKFAALIQADAVLASMARQLAALEASRG